MNKSKINDHYPELTPYKRKSSPNYYVSYYVNKKLKQVSTGEPDCPKKAHRKAIDLFEADIKKFESEIEGEVINLMKACENFIQSLKEPDDEDDKLADGTIQMYETLCNRMQGSATHKNEKVTVDELCHPLEHLDKLEQSDIDSFLKSMKRDYKSHDSYQFHARRLDIFLQWCLSIDEDSGKQKYAINSFFVPKFSTVKKNRKKVFKPRKVRKRKFTDEQTIGILEYLGQSRNQENFCYVLGLVDLPIRVDELASMTKAKVNLNNGTVYIVRSKGSDNGVIKLSNRLQTALREQINLHPESKYLFPSKTSKTGYKSTKNLSWFKQALYHVDPQINTRDDIKKNGGKLVLHGFRKTLCSKLAKIMMPLELKEYFGWKNLDMVLVYYQNDEQDKIAELAANHINVANQMPETVSELESMH